MKWQLCFRDDHEDAANVFSLSASIVLLMSF
jgi:hypothetical protein